MLANEEEVENADDKVTVCTKLRHSRGTPDSRWSFLVLIVCFVSAAITNGSIYSFGVLLPELMDEFQETRAKTALVGSLGMTVGYAISPVMSLSCQRFGFRITALVSSALLVVALALSAATPNLALLYFTYGIVAATGYSVSHNISIVMAMKHFVKWRSLSSGIIQSSFGFGMLFISQTTQTLIDWYGWRWALGGWAVLALVQFFCSFFYDGPENKISERNGQIRRNKIKPVIRSRTSNLSVLKNWLLLLYCVSFALCNMVFYVPIIFMVKFSEKHLNIPRRDSAKLYIYLSIVIIFSRNIYCKLGDFKFFNRFYLFQLSAALAGVSFVLLPYTTSYLHLVLFMVCIGILDGGLWGLSALLVTDCAGVDNLNFAWGIFNFLAACGAAVGPPLAGWIVDKCNSYDPAFYASGVTLIVASLLMFLRRWAQRQTSVNLQNSRQVLVLSEEDDEVLKIFERETVL